MLTDNWALLPVLYNYLHNITEKFKLRKAMRIRVDKLGKIIYLVCKALGKFKMMQLRAKISIAKHRLKRFVTKYVYAWVDKRKWRHMRLIHSFL